jgi:hypothetical protein
MRQFISTAASDWPLSLMTDGVWTICIIVGRGEAAILPLCPPHRGLSWD